MHSTTVGMIICYSELAGIYLLILMLCGAVEIQNRFLRAAYFSRDERFISFAKTHTTHTTAAQ
jgi:hypothetical protein